MGKTNIETKVQELLEPIINTQGYDLYDVQYIKEAKDYYLRITIDNEKGISIEDCENVNNAIDEILDNSDIIKDGYYLEVSSPGIERNLRKNKHFEKQIGKKIYVKLYKALDKNKEFQGILESYTPDELELNIGEKIIKIDNKNISMARTVVDLF